MRIIFLFLSFILMMACEAPKASFKEVVFHKITNTDTHFMAKFQIENNNLLSIPVSDITYKVFIDDEKFMGKNDSTQIHLESGHNSEVVLPLKINHGNLLKTVLKAYKKDQFKYRVEGSASIFNLPIPFSAVGIFNLPPEIKEKRDLLKKMIDGKENDIKSKLLKHFKGF